LEAMPAINRHISLAEKLSGNRVASMRPTKISTVITFC
jgi:hypothetical protein